MTEQVSTNGPSLLRSRTRTLTLWWIAAAGGLTLSVVFHMTQAFTPGTVSMLGGPEIGSVYDQPSIVMFSVDLCLGVLALALLPAALTHDPMEVEESYVGPPSALVAGLVVLTVWMVSVMAAPAGAIVLISISSRLSANWTVPAVFASLLSIVVYELTMSTDLGIDWVVIAMAMGVTLALVGVGALRGTLIRRQARAAGG
ncbi:hypothetical protein NLM24_41115 [Nocardia zapadnayensis]|nr:hypothetical protein [Nocardia zapadnayensis]MCX0276911.1 hypothetical protein [Nocardia zapadnayensis]